MSQMSLTGEAGGYAPNSGRPAYDEIRPLSVRMRDSVRAQLDVLAQLNNRTATEETRLALEHWVERAKTDPALKERADRVRAEIDQEVEQKRRSAEREAQHLRHAIDAVLGIDNGGEDDPADADEDEDAFDEEADFDPESADLLDENEQDESADPVDPEQADAPAEEPAETPEAPVKQARIRRGKASTDSSDTAKAS